MGNYSQTGDIEDAINYMKSKYAGDIDMQAKGVKACIELIKRDYGDSVMTNSDEYGNYNVVLTIFPSGGKIYSYWEIYDGFSYVANGVERMDTDYNNSILLFSSNPSFNRPIVLSMVGK